ncbi:MAG TPA: tetratricopeptide repeat protein, partial [Longimicrobiaceae bacterium]|nr:tetratricopeptide repeat protein [Longimicrobiaceae bacterium]
RNYEGAIELTRQAVALDPKSWRAYGVLGLNQFRSGQIEEARQSLETSFTGDPYNVWIKNTLDLLDTFSRYETRRTVHFELMLHGQEAELLFPYAAELAEEAYEQLAAKYGYRPPTPIRIEVYPSHADFSVRTVGLAGLGALGAAFGNLLAMDSPAAREVGDFNWGSTLWHELAHVFALGLSEQRVPRWLSEGLAVLEERRARPGWGDDVSLPFLLAYQQGKLLPVSQLNRGFVRPQYPEQVIFSYYQASLVAEMIERDHGFGALRQMLRGYGDGRTTEQLLASVLKSDPAAFDRRFDAYLRERFAQPLAALRSAGRQGGAPSADDFAGQLTTGRRLFDEGRLDQAKPYLERAKTLFPEYAGDDSPYLYLASIHKQQGALRQAAEELRKLTVLNENHYAAHLQLAELLDSIGDAAGAAAVLERAIYIYPFEIPLHTRLAALYTQLGERQKAVRERRAVVALRPVDRAEALYQLALAHLEAGEAEAARREVLRALEEAPNFERAQELLLRLRSGSSGLGGEGR